MRLLGIIAAAAAVSLSGCSLGSGGGKLGETGLVQVIDGTTLPAPTGRDVVATSRPYVIGPQDQLSIDVFGIEPLMNRQPIVVDAAGNISFPIAGTIAAAGLTPAQLTEEIETRLRAGFVREPQVSVNVVEAISQTITVDGQVTQPGIYPVVGEMTLMRAVASARGVAEFAALDDVVVLRTVDGQRYAALYNLAAIRRGNYPDPRVYANDSVVVGDSSARRLFKDFLQVVPLLTTPLIVALQN
jgi:polysaccharide biosynthesis/export protein